MSTNASELVSAQLAAQPSAASLGRSSDHAYVCPTCHSRVVLKPLDAPMCMKCHSTKLKKPCSHRYQYLIAR